MKKIIEKSIKWALIDIKKYEHPSLNSFYFINEVGQRLSKNLNANKDIVLLGTILMDIKLGECFNSRNRRSHTKKGALAVKKFLKENGLNEDTTEKVANCVDAHHGEVPYKSLEAEIVANSDCYRFLLPRNLLMHISRNFHRNKNFNEVLTFAEKKIDEKWNILSLNICKKELKPHYKMLKALIAEAKKS